MTANDWIRPDQYRESWLFLVIGTQGAEMNQCHGTIHYWEIAIGNSSELVEIDADHLRNPSVMDEEELVILLMDMLGHRRYQNTLILTPSIESIALLRNRLISLKIEPMTFRGFNHLSIKQVLNQYFDSSLRTHSLDKPTWNQPSLSERMDSGVEPSNIPRKFWELWLNLYQLIPPHVIKGTPL